MVEVYAVVLAGGSGTRFWPASRRHRPKQLLSLIPSVEQSLIAATVERLGALCPPERILIATGRHLLEATQQALPELPASSFLGEPVARNTAACIGWATAVVQRRSPNAVVMVLPSDHHVTDVPAFQATLQRAIEAASQGFITTVGIQPTRAETGYGYIEAGEEALPGGVRWVSRFVEKPDRLRAEQYLASGRHYWNSGMFFYGAAHMREAIERHLPELARGLDRLDRAEGTGDAAAELTSVFEALPSISIDYGVMEKESRLCVVPASFGWNDLGSWFSAWELADKDGAGNAAPPSAVFVDARGNLVCDLRRDAATQTVALVGIQDACVIVTDDSLLILAKDRCEDVRHVVEALRQRGLTQKL